MKGFSQDLEKLENALHRAKRYERRPPRINLGVVSRVKKNSLRNGHFEALDPIGLSFSSVTEWQYIGAATRVFRTPSLQMASKDNVRRHLLRFGAFLLLLVCVCGHVAETFDFWDHTAQTISAEPSLLTPVKKSRRPAKSVSKISGLRASRR